MIGHQIRAPGPSKFHLNCVRRGLPFGEKFVLPRRGQQRTTCLSHILGHDRHAAPPPRPRSGAAPETAAITAATPDTGTHTHGLTGGATAGARGCFRAALNRPQAQAETRQRPPPTTPTHWPTHAHPSLSHTDRTMSARREAQPPHRHTHPLLLSLSSPRSRTDAPPLSPLSRASSFEVGRCRSFPVQSHPPTADPAIRRIARSRLRSTRATLPGVWQTRPETEKRGPPPP